MAFWPVWHPIEEMSLNHALKLILTVTGVLLASDLCGGLKIGAFNVQILGKTKIANTEVVDVLVEIVRRYDVILVQEIRDSVGETVVPTLLAAVNSGSPEHVYQCEVSGNVGRSAQKERYAYLYRNETVDVWDTYQFDDPDDQFEREPFSILISSKETSDSETEPWKFFLLGVHVRPDDVCCELDALGNAYRNTTQAFDGSSGFVLGDLNADCRYLSGCSFQDLEIVQCPFASWLIDFSVDTTTTPNYCAYDRLFDNKHNVRIIALGDTRDHVVPGSAQVYRFDTDLSLSQDLVEDVSDHYPVEVETNNKARCMKTIILIVVLSTHHQAHSRGPHTLNITTDNECRAHTFQQEIKLPNKLEFCIREHFGFTECLKPSDIQSISIIPASTDAWSLTSIVTLARDTFGEVTLLSQDIDIDFAVDEDNRGNDATLHLTLAN